MNRFLHVTVIALTLGLFAGCVTNENGEDDEEVLAPLVDEMGRTITFITVPRTASDAGGDDPVFEVHAAAGAVSSIGSDTAETHVVLPANVWTVVDGSAEGKLKLVPPAGDDPVAAAAGETVRFLVPPFTENVTLTIHTPGADAVTLTVAAPWSSDASLVNGERIIELMEVQEADFPNRQPGQPSYQAFQDYAESFFRDVGYDNVQNDPYDFDAFPAALPVGPNPAVFANVWAYRPGTATPDRIIGFGGHYDMVANTKHAAFDDTSGTIATMVLAETFAQFETDIGLLFGLWGGEESGLLGSQFFVRSNPDIISQMVTYINLDVISMAWPGPLGHPDPIAVSAGPDGPIGDDLLAQSGDLYATYFPQMPRDMLVLEGVAEGQACGTSSSQQDACDGSGVNAQSDHTPFIAAGVPSMFTFTSNITNVFEVIHKQRDTLYNMTWFMVNGAAVSAYAEDGENPPMTDAEAEVGRDLLARSFESMVAFGFYYVNEVDHGLYTPAGRPNPA